MTLHFATDLPRDDLAIGIVVAEGVVAATASSALREATARCVEQRCEGLNAALEARRLACREMLRNGSYKPTGRGKPANEYLLRAAGEGTFPSVNGLVDANNLVSLKHMVPISVWDLDLAGSERFLFRLGAEDERYVFNRGGQELVLRDLICGCSVDAEGRSTPIVNAIKDCLRTKTTDATSRIAAAVYCPLTAELREETIAAITLELAEWLFGCGPDVSGNHGVLHVGDPQELEVGGPTESN